MRQKSRTFYATQSPRHCSQKSVSQLVVVLGRRRVGKTALVLKAFEGETVPVFYFFAERHASEAELVSLWLADICKAYDVQFPPAISNVSELLNYLMTLTKEKNLEIAEVKLNPEKYSAALLEAKAKAFLLENPKLKDYTLKLKGLSLEDM